MTLLKTISHISFIILILLSFHGKSQDASVILSKFKEYRQGNFEEKIYVHTDRDFYICGEIIWFKIYNLNAVNHRPMSLNKVAYIEVLDKDSNPVLQSKIALKEGFGSGSLFLPTTLDGGQYQIRAYTAWMKNYSPDFYFHKEITLVNTFRTIKPAIENVVEKPDVRFFPEGGNLVQGLKSKVAVKGVNADGKSFEFQGRIVNNNGDSVAHFTTQKFGMCTFYFTPEKDQVYNAHIEDKNGRKYSFEIPQVYEEGFVMNLTETDDEILLGVQASEASLQNLYILVHSRLRIVKSEVVAYKGQALTYAIKKSEIPGGISHITLFSHDKKPLCERLYFKKTDDKLVVKSIFGKKSFNARDKVSVELIAADEGGNAEKANLSVAVYQMDSLNTLSSTDIHSYLQLTSELAGKVESPEFYFRDDIADMADYVDNLMLTHGWRRFIWDEVLDGNEKVKEFVPEVRSHIAKARIIDRQTGEPVAGIYGFASTPGRFVNTTTAESDSSGIMTFEMVNFNGSGEVFLQTYGKEDSLYSYEMLSPFSMAFSNIPLQDRPLSPALKEQLEKRSLNMQAQNVYLSEELNRFRKNSDTLSFFYKGDKTYRLDDYTRFTTMEDVMREYVPEIWVRKKGANFNFKTLDVHRNLMFEENPMIFFDGIPVLEVDKIMDIDPLKIGKMEIMTKKFFLGPLTFKGIVSYTTYNGDLDGFAVDPSTNVVSYDGLQFHREFYQPKYDTPESQASRTPDFRNLLYWSPQVLTDEEGKETLEFYTSDLTGDFVMIVEGITSNGLSGGGIFTFKVGREVN